MNCTRNEFISKVHSKWPHKHIGDDVFVTSIGTDIHTVYMLDTLGECQKSASDKTKLASHIWRDGVVTKDVDGLFSSAVTAVNSTHGPITATLPKSQFPNYKVFYTYDLEGPILPISVGGPSKVLKCECGSSSVGSNKHSSYCPIKE